MTQQTVANLMGIKDKAGKKQLATIDDHFTPTPPEGTLALLQHPAFKAHIPAGSFVDEPACGDGAMARVIKAAGYRVLASNLNDRGYGTPDIDFLKLRVNRCPNLVTNPPWAAGTGSAADFLLHAGRLDYSVVWLLLKTQWLHSGSERGRQFLQTPAWKPNYKLELAWRLDFTGQGAGVMDCAWFGWVNPGQDHRGVDYTRLDILHKPVADVFTQAIGAVT